MRGTQKCLRLAFPGLVALAAVSTGACSDKAKEVKAEVKQSSNTEVSDGLEKAETNEKVEQPPFPFLIHLWESKECVSTRGRLVGRV